MNGRSLHPVFYNEVPAHKFSNPEQQSETRADRMNPATHFLSGWMIANVDSLERRDRTLVTAYPPGADQAFIAAMRGRLPFRR